MRPAASTGFPLAVLIPLVVAAISASVALLGLWLNGLRQERARRRELLAKAFSTCVAYKEFPYAVRRRRADEPGEERARLSEALREIQADLAFHQAWTHVGSPAATGSGSSAARRQRRRTTAWSTMREGWEADPTTSDAQMNVTRHRSLRARAAPRELP